MNRNEAYTRARKLANKHQTWYEIWKYGDDGDEIYIVIRADYNRQSFGPYEFDVMVSPEKRYHDNM